MLHTCSIPCAYLHSRCNNNSWIIVTSLLGLRLGLLTNPLAWMAMLCDKMPVVAKEQIKAMAFRLRMQPIVIILKIIIQNSKTAGDRAVRSVESIRDGAGTVTKEGGLTKSQSPHPIELQQSTAAPDDECHRDIVIGSLYISSNVRSETCDSHKQMRCKPQIMHARSFTVLLLLVPHLLAITVPLECAVYPFTSPHLRLREWYWYCNACRYEVVGRQ